MLLALLAATLHTLFVDASPLASDLMVLKLPMGTVSGSPPRMAPRSGSASDMRDCLLAMAHCGSRPLLQS
ncbi:unnamed protein product [Mycena citricolor]|uniref:Secreted protein n=1 Tax=Mycena citricolor TaxID=2018698 RepID=A0AAD2H521_9AGAR|nr:unnamed protein product [Mycena citricolor]